MCIRDRNRRFGPAALIFDESHEKRIESLKTDHRWAAKVDAGKHLVVAYVIRGATIVIVMAYFTSSFDRVSAGKEGRGVWRRVR